MKPPERTRFMVKKRTKKKGSKSKKKGSSASSSDKKNADEWKENYKVLAKQVKSVASSMEVDDACVAPLLGYLSFIEKEREKQVKQMCLTEKEISSVSFGILMKGLAALAEKKMFPQSLMGFRFWNVPLHPLAFSSMTSLSHNFDAIQILELMNCNLGVEHCRLLSQCFAKYHCWNLQEIKLQNNPDLGTAGFTMIMQSLPKVARTLYHMDVSFCGIEGIMGAIQFRNILAHPNCSLQTLKLDGNRIGTDGAVAMFQAVLLNNTLTSISIAGNSIGPSKELEHWIPRCISLNRTCVKYNLDGNLMGDDVGRAIVHVFENFVCNHIVQFSISHFISKDVYVALHKRIAGNKSSKKKKKKGKSKGGRKKGKSKGKRKGKSKGKRRK